MDDLISRQAAIEALGDEPEVWSGKDEYEQGLNNQWHYDVNVLKALPSAQPERKKGEWIVLYDEDSPQDGIWKCSACDYIRLADDITPMNYCPNCGADMRGNAYEDD